MGRQLRFEAARAFRTLRISYRKPMRLIPANETSELTADATTHAEGQPARLIELTLPSAMRIWRVPNSR